jgi:hypothetical protein
VTHRIVVIAGTLVATLGWGTPAGAVWKTGVRSTISAPGVAAGCDGAGAASFPNLAVDPTNPRRMSAVWAVQGITGVASATSADGGRTWAREPVPTATTCTGGPEARRLIVNPRLAEGPEGRVWFGSSWISDTAEPLFAFGTVAHARGPDGWRPGVPLAAGSTAQNVAIVPDRRDPDVAVALTTRMTGPPVPQQVGYSPFYLTDVVAQRTTDGGRSWSAPVVALSGSDDQLNELFAQRLPDGSIVAIVASVPNAEVPGFLVGEFVLGDGRVPFRVVSIRSVDGGVTWSDPVPVGGYELRFLPDPEGRAPAGSSGGDVAGIPGKPDLAVAPDGTLAAVWVTLSDNGEGVVRLVRSRDGGRSWGRVEAAITRPRAVFSPHVAYDGAGRLGVFFYDLADDVLGDEPLTTAGRVAVEHVGGGGFDLVTLPSPFDLRRTFVEGLPYDGGMSLGVTQDLRGLPSGFAAAHTVGPPVSAAPTEVRLTTVVDKRVAAKKRRPARRRKRR